MVDDDSLLCTLSNERYVFTTDDGLHRFTLVVCTVRQENLGILNTLGHFDGIKQAAGIALFNNEPFALFGEVWFACVENSNVMDIGSTIECQRQCAAFALIVNGTGTAIIINLCIDALAVAGFNSSAGR